MSQEKFSQISPSEFFYSNRDLAGFSNPTRSLYTAVREFVENALDACDHAGVLPEVRMSIKPSNPDARDPRHYVLTVSDNGPGMDPEQVPSAFGTVLYGSKFALKQARGMFGLGATMAILYGQITTNKPVVVRSCTGGDTAEEFEMLIDIQKNRPVILSRKTVPAKKTGLRVRISLEGDYSKAGAKIRDYVAQTSLITPYASITFDDPKGEKRSHPRFVRKIPPAPTAIRPHPHGIDVERIRRMIAESRPAIPAVDDAVAKKVRRELGLAGAAGPDTLAKRAAGAKKLTAQSRLVVALASFIGTDLAGLSRVRIEDVDIPNSKIHYWDYGASESRTADLDPESPHYAEIAGLVRGEPLASFLTKGFQRVGPSTASKFAEFAKIPPVKRVGTLTNEELVRLSSSLQGFEGFLPPDPSCLAPLGEEPLEKGIRKFFEPDFAAVVQRPASAYSGFPFVIEMGVAYGGRVAAGGPHVYRFANRIPLLYDEGSDVAVKVASETDWARYKVKGDAPLLIVSHICSTRVPYKTAGKENVADRPEIERELRLAIQFLSRKLASYMSKKGQAEAARKRANLYAKYMPMIAEFCTELAGKKKQPDYSSLVGAAVPAGPPAGAQAGGQAGAEDGSEAGPEAEAGRKAGATEGGSGGK
ncbi:MAG: DNA topoisomerase VI subunit B [Nitrosopumilus sp.]|nr:DNA topoisomerase VI subunit B [Nitrosopumilus sp.]CAI9832119.1 Type 2 DNA topoisomerase 6 subunit B [Nitrosopumilaceae archaeon]MDA7941383.1 DNA topoisomerase VI subunit B [Nitrosopumilus sp.]MDA7942791.1 DNA topoisomerase VI subunit B [Nitrosopumilus sp.]MDA7945077.1 DNA topoisomerase VI subunit B [Nitrosopumilus sp.]